MRTRATTHRPSAGGCDFAVDPKLPANQAPLFWLPQFDPRVVLLSAASDAFNRSLTIGSLTPTFVRRGSEGDHWTVQDAQGRHRFVLTGDAGTATPLAAVIPFDANFAARMDAALRLWRAVAREPRRRPADRLTPQRRQRLILALRALDGRLVGASYRTMAEVLFGKSRVPMGSSWKTHDLRDRTIRLVRSGTKLMQGGYLDLLRDSRSR
jgi:hypothetical protein